jgi:hypothetical protein
MAELKPSTVVLILALVALVVFFVVGVGLSVSGDKPAPSSEERLALREKLFGKPKAVERSELTASGCLGDVKQPRVARNGTCRLEVAKADAALRSMKPATRDGMKLVFTPRGRASTPISVDLRAGKDNEVDLSVPKDGGELVLTCQAPLAATGQCVVVIP